jgi:hypothetical protein
MEFILHRHTASPRRRRGQKKNLKLGTLPDTDVWHKIIHKTSRQKKKKRKKRRRKDICEKC